MGKEPLGQFVVSIDLEMSWGVLHRGRPHDDSPYRDERSIVAEVLELFEQYEISATWAIVGHLFLRECRPVDGVKHPDIARPTYPWLPGDWYELDPCLSMSEAPTWYGPDLVDAIRACEVPQEIASHSFGHLIAGEPGCSPEAFRTDLAASRAVAADAGIELRSFVFPRNSIGHLDVLENAGFTAYRNRPRGSEPSSSGSGRRLVKLLDASRSSSWRPVRPVLNGGLVEIPHTYLFDPGSKKARRFGTRLWSLQQRRRLRYAVRTRSLFHLWFHSHNLAGHRRRARAALDALLSEVRSLIDAGRLENPTMGEIADGMTETTGRLA